MRQRISENVRRIIVNQEERIIFMGTPQIAADVLQRLIDEGRNVVLAVSQPDRPAGRKNRIEPTPVKQLAQAHQIPVFQPQRIKNDYEAIREARPDLIVTCAYGQILPEALLELPVQGCVNLHGSLLPAYRGAAPIQRALWDGQDESGMTLMRMEAGMDTGAVCAMKKMPITETDTTGTLFEKMGALAAGLLMEHLDSLLDGSAVFVPQDEENATYAAMLKPEEEALDFGADDLRMERQIRTFAPHPGAYVTFGGKKLKILEAVYEPGLPASEERPLGTLKKEGKKNLSLQLHAGRLLLKSVQPAGKGVMKAADFANGAGRALEGQVCQEAAAAPEKGD